MEGMQSAIRSDPMEVSSANVDEGWSACARDRYGRYSGEVGR